MYNLVPVCSTNPVEIIISDLVVQLIHDLDDVLGEEGAGGVVAGLGWILGKRLQIIMSVTQCACMCLCVCVCVFV